MVSNILATFILFAIALTAVVLVLGIAQPVANITTKATEIQSAMASMQVVNNIINEVIDEGNGAARLFGFVASDDIESIPEEDALQFKTFTHVEVIDFFSRNVDKNMMIISGNNVNCFERDENGDGSKDLVLENNLIKAVFKKTPKASPLSSLATNETIISLTEKTNNHTIFFTNTSVYVDNFSTAVGAGYSEISFAGMQMPHCQVHVFVNASLSYDIYYKLYTAADFLISEVRNIR